MIFESDKYPMIMYVLILLTLVFILFSISSILDQSELNLSITGFAIQNDSNETLQQEVELYSTKAFTFFYLILIGLLSFIAIVGLLLLLPRIRDYT